VRLVLDTNTIVSGLLWKGPPHALLEAAKLLAELAEVLGREKLAAAVAASGQSPKQ